MFNDEKDDDVYLLLLINILIALMSIMSTIKRAGLV